MPTKQQTITAALTQTLEHKELSPGVSAFKLTRSFAVEGDAPAWFAAMLKESVSRGLAKTSDVKKFAAGKSETLMAERSYVLLSPDYLKLVQEYGYTAPHDDKEMLARMTAAEADPLTLPEGWAVVRADFGSHMLFDVEGRPLPVGVHFDYTNGMIRDGAYDIPRLVEHLKQNPQVRPLRGQNELTALSVPYYNVSAGCAIYAAFMFAPTHEQMQQMWAHAQTLNKKYPSTTLHQAIFDLDLLGLRAAGIARGDTYWDSKEDGPGAESDDNED